jgi:CubicO group peptidase (beta-lactamase class C family)
MQVAVYIGADLVLDEAEGRFAADSPRNVHSSTLFPVFSVTKALPVMAIHLQAERGLVDYGAPVADYWPEYAANGKATITVRDVLAHRAGVPNMPPGVTIDNVGDWEFIVEGLSQVAPLWPTNTRSSYLSYTFGWILGEVVRRTDPLHRTFRDFVIEELLDPLGIDDLHLGVPPESDGVIHRIATLSAPGYAPIPEDHARFRSLAVPPGLGTSPIFNDPRLRAAVFPSAGAIANARSVARLMSVLANHGEIDGVRLYSAERVDSLLPLREDPFAVDEVIGRQVVMTWSGFRRGSDHPHREAVIGTSDQVLGHSGAGGSLAWADLEHGFSAAICHNRMVLADALKPDDHPFARIGDAVRMLVQSCSTGAAP